ncbi:hypothetical protein KKE19_01580 [Patescibacteria group bacterium]|nr:hypothetical protein [Patescibacteria group bacterium]MBU4274484.1 hypothetical protein [Patescibacteria group bacterium]MBU4367389.1 hypothetical protein [Patescibacteria group bacterium]MBU4461710.1 hypothetical protein [Patescibacteria group bacterium]MCG2700093.1 hypothetical protein [Candidatus Parcubacteria bacterium]
MKDRTMPQKRKKPKKISGKEFRKLIKGRNILIKVDKKALKDKDFRSLVANLFQMAFSEEVTQVTLEFKGPF